MSRPQIYHDPGRLPEIIDLCLDALRDSADVRIFRYAGALNRIHVLDKDETGPVKRLKGSVTLVPVDGTHLVEVLTRAAIHTKFDARSGADKIINAPRPVADGILSRGHWPEVPQLTGIVEAATLDLNGNEISQPGYHPATGLWLATSAALPPMKGLRGKETGKRGVDVLNAHLAGFPFVGEADKSAALAAVMTAILRRPMPSAPMFAIPAPTAGTGKTLLAEVVNIIATGRRPPVLSMGVDEQEFAKRVYGMLLANDLTLLIDNITRPIGNEDVLNQLLSQPVLRFRPLGGSGMVSVPTNCLVMATGNNLSIIGDAKRRTCLIRLDARMERPEQREFDKDILAETLSRRDELIRAALEISKSYSAAGCPKVDAKPYGSFADWDRMVRRPLIWHGLLDPLIASEGLREQDPDMECMRLLFAAWIDLYGDQPKAAGDVVRDGLEYAFSGGEALRPDLRDALQMACSEKPNARRLGYWLRNHRDRILDGMQLVQASADSHNKVARWSVVTL